MPTHRPALSRLSTLVLISLLGWGAPQLAIAKKSPAAKAGQASKSAARAQPVARLPTVSAFRFDVAPPPAWVKPLTPPEALTVPGGSLQMRLIDTQVRVNGDSASHYERVIRVAPDANSVGQAAQIEISFDPNYQQLTLHHVEVVRAGQRLNRLDRKRVQMLQRETQLERRMYDGRVTASLVLDDVRPGDEVDFAYTIDGENPVFGGRFVDADWMASMRGPTALVQYRLLTPVERHFQVKVGPADAQKTERELPGSDGKWRETVVTRQKVAGLRFDANAPFTAVLPHQIQVSEFKDWADVAAWGTRLFAVPDGDTPQVDQLVARIKDSTKVPREQVVQALQAVQNDVRYFGNEFGVGSHRPTSPEKVWAQRFGDCKDKTLLLVTVLRKLGIQARPVLVSTQFKQHLSQLQPSPLAFDHVIAEVQLDDQSYHLDGTRNLQTGALAARQSISLMRGLPLAAGTTELATLPLPFKAVRLEVDDRFTVRSFAADVELETRLTYHGELAEGLRATLAQAPADVEGALMQPYLRAYPKIVRQGNLRAENSTQDNSITLVMNYRVPEFWRFPEQKVLVAEMYQWSLLEAARINREPNRREPVLLAYPGIHRHSMRIDFPEDVNQPTENRFDDNTPLLSLRRNLKVLPRSTQSDSELVLGQPEVPAAQVNSYLEHLAKVLPQMALTLSVPAVPPARLESLKQELVKLEEDVQKRRTEATTANQVQAMFKLKVLNAQIASGRLPPKLLSQALVARAQNHDHLGQRNESARDLRDALVADPDNVTAQTAAARNAVLAGRATESREMATKVLQADDSNQDVRFSRAMAAVQLRDFAAARADIERILQDPAQVRQGYPIVWLSLLPPVTGGFELRSITPEQLNTAWPRPLVDWAMGKLSDDDLISAAKSGKSSAEQLCEAYFYLGEKALGAGDKRRAISLYRKSVDQHVIEFIEHATAEQRLKDLDR